MPEGHTFLFLFSEQFDNASGGIKAAIFLIPIAIIALVVVAILKRKKKVRSAVPVAAPEIIKTPEISGKTAEAKPVAVIRNVKDHTAPFVANILIIEDDSIMLLAIRSILAKSGYNLITARDGKEAFEKLDTEEYDVVVTDLMMPYANGLEVVSKIRNDMSKRHVSIIVCSSVGNEETITEAFRLGADDYLKKPIKAEELLTRVKSLLDRRTNNPKLVTKKTARVNV